MWRPPGENILAVIWGGLLPHLSHTPLKTTRICRAKAIVGSDRVGPSPTPVAVHSASSLTWVEAPELTRPSYRMTIYGNIISVTECVVTHLG